MIEQFRDTGVGISAVLEYIERLSPVILDPLPPKPEYIKYDVAPPIDCGRKRPNCSIDGCDKPNFGGGLCAMHYARVRRNGDAGSAGHLPHQAPGRGAAHPKSKLTEDIVLAIRASTEKGVVLADRYGVTATLISNIRKGKVWKHVGVMDDSTRNP